MILSSEELACAEVAVAAIRDAGGFLTFKEYDKAMKDKKYFPPINWIDGWGDPLLHKANTDKLCAFAAVAMGYLVQEYGGYKTVDSSKISALA